jgi:hypothetical protein
VLLVLAAAPVLALPLQQEQCLHLALLLRLLGLPA